MILVLHILPTLGPLAGGLNQAVRNMIGYAEGRDMSHEVLCLDDPAENFLEETGFVVHALGKGRTAWSFNSRMGLWLNDNLNRYQRIIVHGLWQYQSYAVMQAWRGMAAAGAKLYVMPHGMLDPYFQRAKGRRFKAIRNLLFWQFVERHLVNAADGLLFTTKDEELLARDTFRPYRPKAVAVLGLGVKDPPPDPQLPAGFPGGYWLYLGRLHPKKGADLLISAYLKLKIAGYQLPALVMAGPGLDTEYGKKLMELSAGEPQIIFPGMLEGNAKWAAFYGAGIFILPSHQENFGIAVVEAMACGIPVLISDKVNICGEVRAAAAGLVVGDTLDEILNGLMQWLALSAEQQLAFGQNARGLFSQSFAEALVAGRLVDLLRQS